MRKQKTHPVGVEIDRLTNSILNTISGDSFPFDLQIGPSVLTEIDRNIISEIIAQYKLDKKMPAKIRKGISKNGSKKTGLPKKTRLPKVVPAAA